MYISFIIILLHVHCACSRSCLSRSMASLASAIRMCWLQQSELVGGLNPSEKYYSVDSVGIIIPNIPVYGKTKNVPNLQPDNYVITRSCVTLHKHSILHNADAQRLSL